jgi:hypothetical protein
MNRIAEFIRGLPLDARQIASRSGLSEDRVEALLNGSSASLE